MYYKSRLNPFTNGDHLSYIDKYGSKFHTVKTLRKYTKINTILTTYNKIKQLYKSQYYSQKKIVIVKYYYYKSKKKINNEDKNTNDITILENYIKEFIDPDIKVIWKLNNSPSEML